MLKVRHFEMSCQILAHFGFHEKVGTGSNKRPENLKCTYKEQLEDQFATY